MKDYTINGNYALVNKEGQMVTDYIFTNKDTIVITDQVVLAQQVFVAGSEVLKWGASSLFLSEQNVKIFKDKLKHYLVKKAVDDKLNNEQIKILAHEEKMLFNEVVTKKQQEVLKAPIYKTEKEKVTLTLIESELEA